MVWRLTCFVVCAAFNLLFSLLSNVAPISTSPSFAMHELRSKLRGGLRQTTMDERSLRQDKIMEYAQLCDVTARAGCCAHGENTIGSHNEKR